jgi:hypothetical protein
MVVHHTGVDGLAVGNTQGHHHTSDWKDGRDGEMGCISGAPMHLRWGPCHAWTVSRGKGTEGQATPGEYPGAKHTSEGQSHTWEILQGLGTPLMGQVVGAEREMPCHTWEVPRGKSTPPRGKPHLGSPQGLRTPQRGWHATAHHPPPASSAGGAGSRSDLLPCNGPLLAGLSHIRT